MPRWQDSGRPRGYAHVAFAGASGARAAFGRDGQYLNGRYLTVQVRGGRDGIEGSESEGMSAVWLK